MKFAKDMALMALGGCAVIAYQKYQEPIKNGMQEMVNKVNNTLDDMK